MARAQHRVSLFLMMTRDFFHSASDGGTAWFVSFAVSTARTWGTNDCGLDSEGVIGGKLFIGVQFGREGLEISVQSFTTLFEFIHSEGGGLEGVSEGTGLHGEMYSGIRSQGMVHGDLLHNRLLKGPG